MWPQLYNFLSYFFSDAKTGSDKFWADQFHEALEEWRVKGVLDDDQPESTGDPQDPDSTANFNPGAPKPVLYPDETQDESLLQAATFVEEHLGSLSLDHSIFGTKSKRLKTNDEDPEKSDFFNDTIVDEDLLSQVLSNNESDDFINQTVILDSDDDELIELLHELGQDRRDNNKKPTDFPVNFGASTSSNIDPQLVIQDDEHQDEQQQEEEETKSASSSQSTLILSQMSDKSKENYEKEVAETLEMSQILWENDPFEDEQEAKKDDDNDDWADDSFWDNYDFDSVLN